MQKRLFVGLFLLAASSSQLLAEDRIQAFVNQGGKIVFTNFAESVPNVSSAPTALPVSSGLTLYRKEMPANIVPLVETIANTHGVDPNLISAVMKQESNFNRFAVSPKNARGLMQLIPATGRRFGVQDFFDPQQNIEAGVRYLKFLLEKFNGNIELALAGYNAGENLVARLGRVPAITETRNYVRKISAAYRPVAGVVPPVAAAVAPVPAPAQIYRSVDNRGVTHFSNIGPMN